MLGEINLIFVAYAEIYKPASSSMVEIRRAVEPLMNDMIDQSRLAALDVKLRYIPIIMPDGIKEFFPSRSKARKSEKICDLSPQLNYELFITTNLIDAIKEYIRGLEGAPKYLKILGATSDQSEDFIKLIKIVEEVVINNQLSGL
jgi:hypothetical protein